MQHTSNNKTAQFTDEELICAYLWGKEQGLSCCKWIYNFIKNYHLKDFPKLPSYQAFNRRLNRLAGAMAALAEVWNEQLVAKLPAVEQYMVDSCPVMVATGSRSNRAKTAREICNFTRNPAKNQWYHGVKLHAFVAGRPGRLPLPCALKISPASVCDLWAARQIDWDCAPVSHGKLYADRAYIDADWREWMKVERDIDVITPRKRKKYDTLQSGDAASTYISSRRQPVETFFNWLNRKTGLQDASLVRSWRGLLRHIFANLAFAAWNYCFYY